MYDILFPAILYLIDSVLSGIYMQRFLKRKYAKGVVLAAWIAAYFFMQIIVFEVMESMLSVGAFAGIALNIFAVLFLQFIFFEKDMQKQLFTAFSFVAGKENVKYIVSVFSIEVNEVCSEILNYLTAEEIINTLEKSLIWTQAFSLIMVVLCGLLYALLLFIFLLMINRKFIKKNYVLQTQENVFLILPCAAAVCISITMKMMIVSVENGMTMMVYDKIPATKFWIPVICFLLLFTIVASVILFQKLVEYNEENGKRVILENQVRQMQKEIVEIQDIYTDMKGLRHDMRSHLANISLLVKNTAGVMKEELAGYIGKMEETVKKLDFAYQTGNPITDIIIHQKGQEAEKKQIQFNIDFVYPTKLSIDAYDIAVILNNGLENAIEACCRADGKRQITLRSYVKGSLFFLELENDFGGEIILDKASGLPVSSKGNGRLHGIGISNIQRCAKKYLGDIDIVISDTDSRKKFSLTVMMNGKSAAII